MGKLVTLLKSENPDQQYLVSCSFKPVNIDRVLMHHGKPGKSWNIEVMFGTLVTADVKAWTK